MTDRESLLHLALDLAVVAEILEQAPIVTQDLAFAGDRIEAMRKLVDEMLSAPD